MNNNINLAEIDQIYIKESREIYITKSKRAFAGIYRDSYENLEGASYSIFAYLLFHCNFKDNPNFIFNGNLLPLKRGQLVTSLQKISGKTGFSIHQTRTVLTKLEHLSIVSDQSSGVLANRGRLITILDIDKYLVGPEDMAEGLTGNVADGWQTSGRPVATNNKENKENNLKNELQILNPKKISGRNVLAPKKSLREEFSKQLLDADFQNKLIAQYFPNVESIDLHPEFENMSEWLLEAKKAPRKNLSLFVRNWLSKRVLGLPPHEQSLLDSFEVVLFDEKVKETYKKPLSVVRDWVRQGKVVFNPYKKIYTRPDVRI